MNKIDLKTIIKILRNKDKNFLKETRNHDKDLLKVIKLYCLLKHEDYIYNYDYYKSVYRYNKIIEKENQIRKMLKQTLKSYMIE